jgi:hypothetical protein
MPISSANKAATKGPAPPNATMRNRGASTPRRANTFEASAAISALATRIAPSAMASTESPSGPANVSSAARGGAVCNGNFPPSRWPAASSPATRKASVRAGTVEPERP